MQKECRILELVRDLNCSAQTVGYAYCHIARAAAFVEARDSASAVTLLGVACSQLADLPEKLREWHEVLTNAPRLPNPGRALILLEEAQRALDDKAMRENGGLEILVADALKALKGSYTGAEASCKGRSQAR
jgi:hypothetical protein